VRCVRGLRLSDIEDFRGANDYYVGWLAVLFYAWRWRRGYGVKALELEGYTSYRCLMVVWWMVVLYAFYSFTARYSEA
jgi:hypothetical protein